MFVRCVEDLFCVCVFFDVCCMCFKLVFRILYFGILLGQNDSLSQKSYYVASYIHQPPQIRIMVSNSPCQPPWLTWNFWMSTLWQLVGFYVSMPCSQKLCKKIQIHQHQHGTYLALIPLMNFNMGALTWNPFFFAQR